MLPSAKQRLWRFYVHHSVAISSSFATSYADTSAFQLPSSPDDPTFVEVYGDNIRVYIGGRVGTSAVRTGAIVNSATNSVTSFSLPAALIGAEWSW